MKAFTAFMISFYTIAAAAQTESFKYRITDRDSIGNIIFSSEKIAVGQEESVKLKDIFIFGEQIWGRAYFSKKFSDFCFGNRDSFCLFLYINDSLVQKVTQDPPEDDWGQMQIWISGTGNDYFSMFSNTVKVAGMGENVVKVELGIDRYIGTRDVPFSDGTVEKELIYKFISIAKGQFTIVLN